MPNAYEAVLDFTCPYCGQRTLRFRCDLHDGRAEPLEPPCDHMARLEWRGRTRGQRPVCGTWMHPAAQDATISWEVRGIASTEVTVADLRTFTAGHDKRDAVTGRLCYHLRAWGCFLPDVFAFVQTRRRHERIDQLNAAIVKAERQLRHRQRRGSLTHADELRLLTRLLADWDELASLTGKSVGNIEALRNRRSQLGG